VSPLRASAQIINISDQKVWDAQTDIPASAFGSGRTAPLEIALPFDKLTRGAYLLSVSIERADGAKTRSDLVFRIR
jgi:hypothetical protein